MSDATHIADDDLVLIALQFLPEDLMRPAREHLQDCAACRTELARLRGDLVAYALTAEVAEPPAEARERLMRQVGKEPRMVVAAPEPVVSAKPERSARPEGIAEPTIPTRLGRRLSAEDQAEEEEARRPRPRRAPWVLAWVGWAIAVGCSFLAGLELHQRQQLQNSMVTQEAQLVQSNQEAAHAQAALDTLTATNAQQVALHLTAVTAPKKGANAAANAAVLPEALAAYIAQKGALVFVATHLQPVAPDKTYELWLLPGNGLSPIPAGTFKPDAQGSASVVMPQLPKGVPAKGFGVTIENAGGATTPTLPIVMAGT